MQTDLTYMKSMFGDNKKVLKEMIDIFAEQVVEISEQMDNAFQKKDYVTLGKLAHKAKASVSMMGMKDLAVMLKDLELNAAESKQAETYEGTVTQFKNCCAIAVEELYNFLEKE